MSLHFKVTDSGIYRNGYELETYISMPYGLSYTRKYGPRKTSYITNIKNNLEGHQLSIHKLTYLLIIG